LRRPQLPFRATKLTPMAQNAFPVQQKA